MPNDMPGAARYVRTTMATPTAGVGVPPTWRGSSMNPVTVAALLPGVSFDARGRGVFNLTTAVRFPRGPRISGHQGSVDLHLVVGLDGTARTLCYLTDDPAQPTTYLAVRLDSQNRPYLDVVRPQTPFVFAGGRLSASGPITNTETVTLDTKTYTIESTLTNVNGNVKQGANEIETLANLAAAINLTSGAGTKYAAATTVHPTVRAETEANVLIATAKTPGPGGNAIASTELCANAQWDNGATLVDGAGLVVQVTLTDPTQAPAATNIDPDQPIHLRLTWDTAKAVLGARFASFSVNGGAIPETHWTTDPTAAWPFWQPTHLVLGGGLLYQGDADFNGLILSAQLSEVVTP